MVIFLFLLAAFIYLCYAFHCVTHDKIIRDPISEFFCLIGWIDYVEYKGADEWGRKLPPPPPKMTDHERIKKLRAFMKENEGQTHEHE